MAGGAAPRRQLSRTIRGVKTVTPVLAAGGTFAAITVAGLFAGAWLAGHFRSPILVVGGLFVGLAFGGYSAYRLLLRSM